MKGGGTLTRTILVTECEHKITKEQRVFYGRYDPVTLERGKWKIINTYQQKYTMSDEDFVKHGKLKED